MPEKELSRLEKLEAKMAQVKRQIALERRKESERARKERTHRLIRRGGLVEMVLGEHVDAGLLVGVLLKNQQLFEEGSGQGSEAFELKRLGDGLIAEREAKKGGGKEHAEHRDAGAGGGGEEGEGVSAEGAGGAG